MAQRVLLARRLAPRDIMFFVSAKHYRSLSSQPTLRSFSQSATKGARQESDTSQDRYRGDRLASMIGHSFPDFIDDWNRDTFRKVGYGMTGATVLSAALPPLLMGAALTPTAFVPAAVIGLLTAGYWRVGLADIAQNSHAVRRNYPVIGNLRYILETIRPELRQYFVESDHDGRPYDRLHRTQIYQRAKNVNDTLAFGTRRNVYACHHEWACHSMWPTEVDLTAADAVRHTIGSAEYGTTKPYSASVLNISGMSYGAISDHAILALSRGAKMGGFYQSTGEGGVSRFHLEGGGDLVWNIGGGYFGCGSGKGEKRIFEPTLFREVIESSQGRVKMIELKLSQGAKPGHGGLLPKAKISKEIAETRKLDFPATEDCHSPARHSSFSNAHELVEFVATLREQGGGIPVGLKMCVGEPIDFAKLARAMIDIGNGPDFITVDGAEGGTGAAPPELTDSVGLPLEEGLVLVHNLLVGAGLRGNTSIIASGRVVSGFSLIRTLALGADVGAAARAFMMSLGCIQALKCNTNRCPTGVATLDKDLMFGLDPEEKSVRGKF
jgi:glutamate synthase domain-containing protein 2